MKEAGAALLTRLLEMVLADIPGGVGVGLTVVLEGRRRSVAVVGVGPSLDEDQWREDDGPAWQALRSGRPVLLDLPSGPEADEADEAEGEGARGLLVTTAEEDADHGLVVTLYLDRPARTEDLTRLDRIQPLLNSAVAVVEYCSGEEERAEQMVQMVQYRRVIEQAKGLLMAATAVDAESAFATLARASQHFNVRLRNLSVALVELVGGGPAEGPTDPAAVVTPSERDRLAAERMWAALRVPGSAGPGEDT